EAADAEQSLSYAGLVAMVDKLAGKLRQADARVAAILADNTPDWCVADLALIAAAIPSVPVPHFFSPEQISHLFRSAGVNLLITDRPEQALQLLRATGIEAGAAQSFDCGSLYGITLPALAAVDLPAGCAKITFTSGSTGDPKGVCLTQATMETVATSLAGATAAAATDRHLSAMPYATLLENIGGLYAPLLAGATVCAHGLAAVGLSGASGLDVRAFVTRLAVSGATTTIMIPQMLHALVTALEMGMPKPAALRFIAVGGAPVSLHLLERAERLGLPVFEGYGLSEAGSVVAVNRPGAVKPGSVGKPLPHVRLSFAGDGEILVEGNLFSGYLGEAPRGDAAWPTGDLGYLDDEGFLHLSGRKKHIFITAFGRNVSPEWVERELAIEPAIAQACVFGEAKSYNVAVIQPRQGADAQAVMAAVAAANDRLPDYARVSRWVTAREPFSVGNGQWTGTGRPRRGEIERSYAAELTSLYEEQA
ncbi:MAG TPA: AMP-binding protein, partial [Mariprofundaceae bacterium]|nr:AMP-binding protein [Mariprofundaceae bacterium]